MGNSQKSISKKSFDMNIQLIGEKLNNYRDSISKVKNENYIQNFWKFNYDDYPDTHAQINKYFFKLKQFKNAEKKTICLKECLLVRVKNKNDPLINLIIEKVNELGEIQYMPIVLFLLENDYSKYFKLSINEKKYKRVEPRLIIAAKYDENNPNNIEPLLLRFCSIHNELGDKFTVGEGDNAKFYNLIAHNSYKKFINIACIGRFGQGKSTGINMILGEYKAKESAKGSSQTKEIIYYYNSNGPIKIIDIPGFEDTETVRKVVEMFQQYQKRINDYLHIIIYFLKYGEDRQFMKLELPILEEICNHKKSKLIYVITHSNSNMDDTDKKIVIDQINEGLQGVTQNSKIYNETLKNGILEANLKNVKFVNFLRDNKYGIEPFGTNNLFADILILISKINEKINYW